MLLLLHTVQSYWKTHVAHLKVIKHAISPCKLPKYTLFLKEIITVYENPLYMIVESTDFADIMMKKSTSTVELCYKDFSLQLKLVLPMVSFLRWNFTEFGSLRLLKIVLLVRVVALSGWSLGSTVHIYFCDLHSSMETLSY